VAELTLGSIFCNYDQPLPGWLVVHLHWQMVGQGPLQRLPTSHATQGGTTAVLLEVDGWVKATCGEGPCQAATSTLACPPGLGSSCVPLSAKL